MKAMAAKQSADGGPVTVVAVPGLNFEPVTTTPEEAAELVASGSFQYPEPETAPEPEV